MYVQPLLSLLVQEKNPEKFISLQKINQPSFLFGFPPVFLHDPAMSLNNRFMDFCFSLWRAFESVFKIEVKCYNSKIRNRIKFWFTFDGFSWVVLISMGGM